MNYINTKIPKELAYICVILSGSLGFLIQPLMGKTLIPFFGGAPASWIGSLLFFQTSLLLGYLWAFWLLTKPIRFQVIATATLGLIAILSFRSPEAIAHPSPTILGVIWTLTKSCLPACAFIFSTTLMVSGWLSKQNHKIPYTIYAVSNLGSLTGLLVYAFLLEPNSPISTHSQIWYTGLVVFFLLLSFLGIRSLKAQQAQGPDLSNNQTPSCTQSLTPKPTHIEIGQWIAYSALACSLMIAATYLMAGEIGSNPVTWVGPFGLYLLAFSISFTGIIKKSHLPMITIITLALFCLWTIASTTLQAIGPTILPTMFGCCLIILTKLYHSQPQEDYRLYLLAMAVGGSLGGLASSFLIPIIFQNPTEFFYLSLISVTIGLASLTQKRWHAIPIALGIGLLPFLAKESRNQEPSPFPLYKRDSISSLKISLQGPVLSIVSQNTHHGSQLISDAKIATSYYSPHSPPGLYLKSQEKPLNVGIVGLSSGTLTSYSKKEDTYTFWDIDPKIPAIARDIFGYIKSSLGKVNIELGDGRLKLESSKDDYDVLIIDAYSGDAIPPHLITKEALSCYKKRLEKKNGLLFIHHSTRYSNYTPIIEATAKSLNMDSLTIVTTPEKIDPLSSRTRYTIISTDDKIKIKDLLTLKPNIHEIEKAKDVKKSIVWTDEFNSALHAIEPMKIFGNWKSF